MRKLAEHSEKTAKRAASRPAGLKEQTELFEKASALFHARDFAKAMALFEQAEEGPAIQIAHSARTHAQICRQRLEREAPQLSTANDYYNYAVAQINWGELEPALSHLNQAIALDPDADHIYYALSLCHALKGNMDEACANMKRAIEIQPGNRTQARNDPDFRDFARRPPLSYLLYPERERPA